MTYGNDDSYYIKENNEIVSYEKMLNRLKGMKDKQTLTINKLG